MRTLVALALSFVLISGANAQGGTVYKIKEICGFDMAAILQRHPREEDSRLEGMSRQE